MSTSSSEEGSGMVGHSATSSGLESTGSLLFSVPSDSSDVQTEITPPTSPALSEGKMRTPRDILDASRRLGQISVSALTPTKPPKQLCHQTSSKSVADDEAGYEADGDGDGDGGDKGTRARADAPATTLPTRRPGFLRIDTRQHRRVASMLAIRHPSPGFGFGDVDAYTDIPHPPRAVLASPSSMRLTSITTTTTTVARSGGNAESYELRRRPRQKVEPVGLGIGFPENHPLRSRAFTMPVSSTSTSVSPVDDFGPSMGLEKAKAKERQSEWFPSPAWLKKSVQVAVCAPSPVRLAKLRPTFLEVSPSPIEYLPGAAGAGAGLTFRCDVDVVDRSPDHGNLRTMGVFGCDTEMERERYDALAREGQMDLDPSESMVTFSASSEVTMTFDVESHSAWSPKRAP